LFSGGKCQSGILTLSGAVGLQRGIDITGKVSDIDRIDKFVLVELVHVVSASGFLRSELSFGDPSH
jgi:hypothetical protein